MEEIAHRKSLVAKAREEKAKQSELTKTMKAAEKASTDAAKKVKAANKERRELTLEKWKEEDNRGLRKKILQCVVQDESSSSHIPYGRDPILWQIKINQKIAKAKLIAKRNRKDNGVLLPNFPPLLELLWFFGCKAPLITPSVNLPVPQQQPVNYEYQSSSMHAILRSSTIVTHVYGSVVEYHGPIPFAPGVEMGFTRLPHVNTSHALSHGRGFIP